MSYWIKVTPLLPSQTHQQQEESKGEEISTQHNCSRVSVIGMNDSHVQCRMECDSNNCNHIWDGRCNKCTCTEEKKCSCYDKRTFNTFKKARKGPGMN